MVAPCHRYPTLHEYSAQGDESESVSCFDSASVDGSICSPDCLDSRYTFHFKTLKKALQHVVARRGIAGEQSGPIPRSMELCDDIVDPMEQHKVAEIIALRPYDPMIRYMGKASKVTCLGREVESQLATYIEEIAKLYNDDNHFHSFDHATHVMKAVVKLFEPINARKPNEDSRKMHERTYGIAFDPLVQFTCLLAALVHDVDHPAVPNDQFMDEDPKLAERYCHQSVAEKVSFDHAWDMLTQERFYELRSSIYGSVQEFKRFRALLVNAVMGTDAFDKNLAAMRNQRWNRAFRVERITNPQRSMDRKATIVIHYILLAADVSHTMEAWSVYQNWNSKLFFEMTSAWQYGRNETEPATKWYEGEIGFFDGWVIPLAQKLKSLGTFGILGDSNLSFAMENRRRWEEEGIDAIQTMEAKFDELDV